MPRHIDRLAPQRRLQPGALDCDGKAREQHLADRHLVNDRVEPIGKQELNIWRLAAYLYFNQRLYPRMGHHWQSPASCWSISGCAVHMAPKQDFFLAARASYIAGFAGTATMLADKLYGIPTFGTMAHSFIQAYDNESQAFEDFVRSRPQDLTILIDTYDTEAAAKKVVALAPRLKLDRDHCPRRSAGQRRSDGTVQERPPYSGRRRSQGCKHPAIFQLPTISAPTVAPSAMSVRRDSPRHMTELPGGGSLARAR